jgi:hypothetical protein
MQLLQELQDRGFKVSVVKGDTLKVIPGSKLTPELIERLRTEKPRLIKILMQNIAPDKYEKASYISRLQIQMDAYLDTAIARLNEYYRIHGLRKTPPHNEPLARVESEITRCFQSADISAFKVSVDEWEQYFMSKHDDT